MGTVNGSVSTGTGYRRFRGLAVLTVACLPAAPLLLLLLLLSGFGRYLILVVVLCVMAMCMPFACRLLISSWTGGRTASVSSRARGRAAPGTSLTGRGVRAAMRGVRAAINHGLDSARTQHPFTERRFNVQLPTGEIVAVLVRGDLSGPDPSHGDLVCVEGRRSRKGYHIARSVEILSSATGAVVTRLAGRLPGGLRLRIVADFGCYGLAVLVLAGAAHLVLRWPS